MQKRLELIACLCSNESNKCEEIEFIHGLIYIKIKY